MPLHVCSVLQKLNRIIKRLGCSIPPALYGPDFEDWVDTL